MYERGFYDRQPSYAPGRLGLERGATPFIWLGPQSYNFQQRRVYHDFILQMVREKGWSSPDALEIVYSGQGDAVDQRMYEIMISWGYCREALEFFGLLRPRGGMHGASEPSYGGAGGFNSSAAGPSRETAIPGSDTNSSRQVRAVGGFHLAGDPRGNATSRTQPQSSSINHESRRRGAAASPVSPPEIAKKDSAPPPSPPEMDPRDYFIGDFMTEDDDFIEDFH